MDIFFVVVVISYLIGVILLANIIDKRRQRSTRPVTGPTLGYPYGVAASPPPTTPPPPKDNNSLGTLYNLLVSGLLGVVLLNSGGILLSAFTPDLAPEAPQTSTNTALVILFLSAVSGALCGLILFSDAFRQALAARWIPAFSPESVVHRTAFILGILLLLVTLIDVLQVGGVEGLAEEFEQQPISQWDAILTLLGMVFIAFLGVGWFVRRSLSEVLQRLELRLPNAPDILWGLGTAFACLFAIFIFVSVLSLVLSPEALESQGAASDQIAQVLSQSLWIAFLAAMSAAIGEEILFRGALQPIFGIIPTTLLFALLHSQYAFTPGSVAILLVGGAFAWLKERQSTTAAIIAHFAYNFVLLALAYVAFRLEEMGITPESLEGSLYLLRTLTNS